MSPNTLLQRVLAGLFALAVWTDGLLSNAVISADTGKAEVETYSDWEWDGISLGTTDKDPTAKGEAPTPEDEAPVVKSGKAAVDGADISVPTEEADSEARPQKGRANEKDSSEIGAAEQAEQGELNFDMDWSGFEIEDAEVGADQNASRRAAREEKMARLANKPRVGSTAEPDFAAPIREGYQLFPGMRPYAVISSMKDPDMHPCLDCHDWAESDLTPRLLKEPHDNFRLEHGLHGKGEFWCLTCHHLEGEGGLRTFEGVKLSFDEAYILCSQCHSQEGEDWAFGAHGKRVDNWRGERRILNCTACHYQHRPTYDPRKPMPKPTLRMGLVQPGHPAQDGSSPAHRHKTEKVWERYSDKHGEGE